MRAGEEGRQEHAQHVELDHRRGGRKVMMVMDHGERGCRHRQDHDAVAGRRAEQGDQVSGLGHNGPQGSAQRRFTGIHFGGRNLQRQHDARAEHRDQRQQQERADIFRLHKRAAKPAEHRPGKSRDDATGQYQRDGAGPKGLIGDLAGGEAIELRECLVGPDKEGAERQ